MPDHISRNWPEFPGRLNMGISWPPLMSASLYRGKALNSGFGGLNCIYFLLDDWEHCYVSSKLMKKARFLLITRLRSVTSAAMLGIFLVLSGGTLALADGLVDLNAQTVAGCSTKMTAHELPLPDDDCPVCPHSHHSDSDHSCSCSHFQTSPEQTFFTLLCPTLTSSRNSGNPSASSLTFISNDSSPRKYKPETPQRE